MRISSNITRIRRSSVGSASRTHVALPRRSGVRIPSGERCKIFLGFYQFSERNNLGRTGRNLRNHARNNNLATLNEITLQEHSFTHQNQNLDPQLKCEHCGKFFATKITKLVHIRCVHIKDRSWKCEQCGDTFYYAASLRNHTRKLHG